MNKKHLLILALSCTMIMLYAQKDPKSTELYEPVPPKVEPGENGGPPADAIVLFDGTDLSKFESAKGGEAKWKVENGHMTVVPKSGSLRTKQKFGDCQLHIEWRVPPGDEDEGQGDGNSGVILMGKYEVQVLNSYDNETYVNGQAASIYKQHIPLVNACKKPGEWQSYDIIFTAPRFGESGRVVIPARFTVLHNGVLVQNNVSLLGPIKYIGMPVYKEHGEKEPLLLQDHGNKVSYRNIWIREL